MAPSIETITVVFGVADAADKAPDDANFFDVYRVGLPVFHLVALDPDGVHEFDAVGLFEHLSTRATRRNWGVRLELAVLQPARDAGRLDLVVDAPEGAGALSASDAPGTILPGGARRVTVLTAVAATPAAIANLAGAYTVRAGDAAGRTVTLAVDRFEFQP